QRLVGARWKNSSFSGARVVVTAATVTVLAESQISYRPMRQKAGDGGDGYNGEAANGGYTLASSQTERVVERGGGCQRSSEPGRQQHVGESGEKLDSVGSGAEGAGEPLFLNRKYQEAAACYSKAISHCPSVPAYYTNRALCHVKLQQYDRALADCRHALELDGQSVKAHFFMGQCHLETETTTRPSATCRKVRGFQTSYNLAKEQRLNFGDDIPSALRLARRNGGAAWRRRGSTRRASCTPTSPNSSSLRRRGRFNRRVPESTGTVLVSDILLCDKYLSDMEELFCQVDEKRKFMSRSADARLPVL
ncbi:hypothetical protein INR49_010106, partial [Caranx melampygus]